MNTTEQKTMLYYGQDKQRDEYVDRIISRDVLYCQSCLVDDILRHGMETDGPSFDDVEGLYPDPSGWTAEQCEEWITDNGCDLPDHPGDTDDTDDYLDALAETVNENAEAAEIYEWWLVTDWLARKLRDQGEAILKSQGCIWWGRQCTGQAIKLDPTMYDIAASLLD